MMAPLLARKVPSAGSTGQTVTGPLRLRLGAIRSGVHLGCRDRRTAAYAGGPWRNEIEAPDDISPGQAAFFAGQYEAPPAGFEPALTAPEAVALSPELWGLSAVERVPVNEPFPDTRRKARRSLARRRRRPAA